MPPRAAGQGRIGGGIRRRRVRRAVPRLPPLSAAATDTRPVAAARRGRLAPLPRGTRNRAAYPPRRGTARHTVAAERGAESLRNTADADEDASYRHCALRKQLVKFCICCRPRVRSLSRARAQQADGDEADFIMKSSGIAILRKAEMVLLRQVSSMVVALSGIHEWFLGNEGLVEVSVQRPKVTAAAIKSTLEFSFQRTKPAGIIYRCECV